MEVRQGNVIISYEGVVCEGEIMFLKGTACLIDSVIIGKDYQKASKLMIEVIHKLKKEQGI